MTKSDRMFDQAEGKIGKETICMSCMHAEVCKFRLSYDKYLTQLLLVSKEPEAENFELSLRCSHYRRPFTTRDYENHIESLGGN